MFPSDDELIEIGTKVHTEISKDITEHRLLCKYGLGWRNGFIYSSPATYCHAGLMRFYREDVNKGTKEGPVVIANRIQYEYTGAKGRKKDIHRYTSFLMNDSVFSGCIVNKDVSKVGEQGIIVRTDKPPNLVAAACIATRQAWEHPWVMDTTLTLIEEGVPPRIAEVVSYLASTKGSELVFSPTGGHSPLRLSGLSKKVIKAVLECDLIKTGKYNTGTYQKEQGYTGIPEMWGYGSSPAFKPDIYDRPKESPRDPFKLLDYTKGEKVATRAERIMEAFKEFL